MSRINLGHEDARCGNGCGAEPLGCGTCEEVIGTSYLREAAEENEESPFAYDWEDDEDGCSTCDLSDKCEYCPKGAALLGARATCPLGPCPSDRPDYRHLLAVLMGDDPHMMFRDAVGSLDGDYDRACEACRIGCSCCDYSWQRDKLDKGAGFDGDDFLTEVL